MFVRHVLTVREFSPVSLFIESNTVCMLNWSIVTQVLSLNCEGTHHFAFRSKEAAWRTISDGVPCVGMMDGAAKN